MNLPKEQENSYLAQHFEKLDKDFANIVKASKTRDMFVKSIEFMETLRDQEANKKNSKKEAAKGKIGASGYQPTYLLINKNAMSGASGSSAGVSAARTFVQRKDAHNERAQRQDEIERRLVAQLGDRFREARLVEVSEGSYLIQNRIRLPIFGKTVRRLQRTKSNISKKEYLLNL